MNFFTFTTKLLRTFLLAAVLAVGAGWLAGCGGGDNPGDNGGGEGGGSGSGSYESVTIGDKKWMKKNLDIKTEESWCYGEGGPVIVEYGPNDDPVFRTLSSSEIQDNCNKYGRLYTWAAAKKACPSGWKLPSRADWDTLAAKVGGVKDYESEDSRHYWEDAGRKLKSTSGWNNRSDGSGNGTDNYGFTALPGGGRRFSGEFLNAGSYGGWWAAPEDDGEGAYGRLMYYGRDLLDEDAYDERLAFSVRCLED